MKIRFLSVMIFVTVLMLSVRVGNILDGVGGVLQGSASVGDAIYVAGARAQAKGEAPDSTPETENAEVKQVPAEVEAEVEQVPVEADDPDAVSRLVTNDPALLTQAEIDLLQRLAERREILEVQGKEMLMREGLLQAVEERIDKKIAELQNFQDTIEKLVKKYDADQVNKIQGLVKIYENMKPKNAARIFEELDMGTLLMVTERMGARRLAPIMAKMDPVRATEITVELSRLRNLPSEALKVGG
jgi:flagellar motility protein MotE (MotC chaperone)